VVSPEILDEYRRVGRELAAGREAVERALDALLAVVAVHAIVGWQAIEIIKPRRFVPPGSYRRGPNDACC